MAVFCCKSTTLLLQGHIRGRASISDRKKKLSKLSLPSKLHLEQSEKFRVKSESDFPTNPWYICCNKLTMICKLITLDGALSVS